MATRPTAQVSFDDQDQTQPDGTSSTGTPVISGSPTSETQQPQYGVSVQPNTPPDFNTFSRAQDPTGMGSPPHELEAAKNILDNIGDSLLTHNISPNIDPSLLKTLKNVRDYSTKLGNEYGKVMDNFDPSTFTPATVEISDKTPTQMLQATIDARTNKQAQLDDIEQKVMEGKLDPDHYWKSRTTFENMLNVLATVGGTYSQLVLGRGNPAKDIIDAGIARDWEAQKQDLGKLVTMHNLVTGDVDRLTKQQITDLDAVTRTQALETEDKLAKVTGALGYLKAKSGKLEYLKGAEQAAGLTQTLKEKQQEELEKWTRIYQGGVGDLMKDMGLYYNNYQTKPMSPQSENQLNFQKQGIKSLLERLDRLESGTQETYPVVGRLPVVGKEITEMDPDTQKRNLAYIDYAKSKGIQVGRADISKAAENALGAATDTRAQQITKTKNALEDVSGDFESNLKDPSKRVYFMRDPETMQLLNQAKARLTNKKTSSITPDQAREELKRRGLIK